MRGRSPFPRHRRRFAVFVGVHGSGGGTRAAPLFQHLQTLLPRHGIATFIFDRRREGDSTGVPFDAGFEVLAEDVRACARRLRQHLLINPAKVGLWSISLAGRRPGD